MAEELFPSFGTARVRFIVRQFAAILLRHKLIFAFWRHLDPPAILHFRNVTTQRVLEQETNLKLTESPANREYDRFFIKLQLDVLRTESQYRIFVTF